MQPDDAPHDGVALRTLVVGDLPLLVAAIGAGGRGPHLEAALQDRGLRRLPGFLGHDLPQGARVGFVLDANELRLVDDADATLLRAQRSGLDEGWRSAALRLKGTMLVAIGAADIATVEPPRLPGVVDAAVRDGGGLGAIVGVVEERPSLPLLF